VIDPKTCLGCGMCAVKCPRGVIRDIRGIITDAE
jgi:ferredoxin